jgi:hypothetical protein
MSDRTSMTITGNAGDADDVLLSRAVAGDRTAIEEVRARSVAEPALLEELALWQADELRLARAVRSLDAVAGRVDAVRARSGARGRPMVASRAGLGWAVAAVLAVALAARDWSGARDGAAAAPSTATVNVAGLGSAFSPGFASSDDAFDAYLAKAREEGALVGDPQPPVFLGSRELGDGSGFEVVVVRQIYEIRRTSEMYRMQPIDETGRVRPVVIRPRTETVR